MTTSLFNRIRPDQIADRLDGEYYAKELLENETKLNHFNQVTLENCVTNIRNAISDLTSNGSFEFLRGIQFNNTNGIPYVRTQNLMDGYIDFSDGIYVDLKCKDMVAKSLCETGDLIVCRKGKVGAASAVSADMHGAAISENVTRFRLDNSCDADFLATFLNSNHGRMRFLREATGVIQKWINNEKLRQIRVIRIDSSAEKYIGDKVRQAEKLRAWAKRLERSLDAFIDHFQPEKKEYKKLFSRVPNNLLTNMLTATTYRERYISNQKNLKAISRIQPISYYLSSITNGYDERNEIENGLPYVKVANVRAGYIDLKNTPRVRLSALTDASSKQKPEKGDLLLTRKGSFGIAAVVMESASFLCSSEVFSCKPSKPEFMPILSWFLNSEAGNMQFWQFSTGTTMPGINQENLQNILIPDFSACDIEQFNSIHKNRYEAKKNAELLTDTAKTLVEALIEGQLTEQQLIQAQQALEDGDNSLDQAILSKLSAEGYAIEGATPLFSDVDELYSLLEEAAQAEAEE